MGQGVSFKADNSEESWATAVGFYDSTLLVIDGLSLVIGLTGKKQVACAE